MKGFEGHQGINTNEGSFVPFENRLKFDSILAFTK
jgi:hypothetical protein